mmetsp:Transcript_12332/g.30022  ORF Transcript_12332/g.30022 Transcript_12332/m.30022 type:complete len:251 (-) Transcript_12332:646-1398(-)
MSLGRVVRLLRERSRVLIRPGCAKSISNAGRPSPERSSDCSCIAPILKRPRIKSPNSASEMRPLPSSSLSSRTASISNRRCCKSTRWRPSCSSVRLIVPLPSASNALNMLSMLSPIRALFALKYPTIAGPSKPSTEAGGDTIGQPEVSSSVRFVSALRLRGRVSTRFLATLSEVRRVCICSPSSLEMTLSASVRRVTAVIVRMMGGTATRPMPARMQLPVLLHTCNALSILSIPGGPFDMTCSGIMRGLS